MLGFTSERSPRGGALTLNTVSAIGLLSVGIIGGPILGMAFDVVGRNHWSMIYINLFGFACLVAVAKVVTFYKSEPWRRVPEKKPETASGQGRMPGGSSAQPAE